MDKKYTIAVAGTGYVGLSNATLQAYFITKREEHDTFIFPEN